MTFEVKKLDQTGIRLAGELFISFQKEDEVKDPTSASDEYLTNLLRGDDFFVIVAIADEKVIGGLTAYELRKYKREETVVFIYELGVEKPFQRQGIATALIESLKGVCREKGIKEMFVGALADNKPAVKLYENTGGDAEKVVEFRYELD